jgi:EAL domain-containing protein (putative c-di-GMP-specific phosphodiesterase class I)
MRLHSVSLYNTDADVLWLSEGALGPDEHNVVVEAIETQKEEKSQGYFEFGMEDGRMAIFLPIRLPRGDLAGTVMILADMKSLNEGTMERIVTPAIRSILVKIAMFMGKNAPAATADAPPEVAMPGSAPVAPVNLSSTTVIEKLPAAMPQTLGPREVEQILELELVEAPPPPAPSSQGSASQAGRGSALGGASSGAAANRKGAPQPPAAVPSPKAALRGGASPAANFPNAASANAASAGSAASFSSAGSGASARTPPTLAPVPSKGAPATAATFASSPAEIEVLPFDPSISIPVAKPASRPVAVPAEDVLAFEPDIQIPTAKPAAGPPPDIEVLAFEAEPPVVSAAPAVAAPPTLSAAPAASAPTLSAASSAPTSAPTLSAASSALTSAPTVSSSAAMAPSASPSNAPPTVKAGAPSPFATNATSAVRKLKVTATSIPARASASAATSAATSALTSASASASASAATSASASASASATSAATSGAMSATTAAPTAGSTSTTTNSVRALSGAASAAPAASKTSAFATPSQNKSAPASTTASPGSAAPAATSASTFAASSKSTAKPAASASSTAQTAALPVVTQTTDDDDVGLIQDTGPVPVLSESSIQPTPDLPPLEPLSVEESATDLTLFAQELIKLRSNGRTRRYEVLARSQRDAHRNEVPAAFVADTARGKDGAALDFMVMERLLAWLGQHGEAIWDSEPASFSVNVSIGAIEDATFLQRVEQLLTQHSVPAEYVGFELSEFACVQHKPAVQRFVETVENMGCFLVIDNFSMNSAVFELLGSKALRHVKLDPKLTVAAMKDKLPQALVVAILQACKVLGVHCVAKRVESQSSMQWLTAVGCDFAQSFLMQKPLPLESLASGQPIKALRE